MIEDWNKYINHTADLIESRSPKKFNRSKFSSWLKEKEYMKIRPFDDVLTYKCWEVHNKLQNDYDNWWVVAGKEGYGKSTLAVNAACLISDNFDNKNIVLSAEQFNEAFRNAKAGDTIVLDEGGALLFSRDAMSSKTKFVIKSAMVARAKNVNMIVVVPNFFLIDTYIRDHRADLLLQIKKVRGEYRGIQGHGLLKVSAEGWKYKNVFSVKIPTHTFWDGDFCKDVSKNFDWVLYKKNKDAYIKEFLDGESNIAENTLIQTSQAAKILSVSSITLSRMIERGEIEGKKIGFKWFMPKSEFDKLMKMPNREEYKSFAKAVKAEVGEV